MIFELSQGRAERGTALPLPTAALHLQPSFIGAQRQLGGECEGQGPLPTLAGNTESYLSVWIAGTACILPFGHLNRSRSYSSLVLAVFLDGGELHADPCRACTFISIVISSERTFMIPPPSLSFSFYSTIFSKFHHLLFY